MLAAYERTIKAAIAFGNKKVFLTLVGCGVFNNELAWVADAVERCKKDIQDYGLEVTLIVYDANSRQDGTFPPFLERMKLLVNETHGSYKELFEGFGWIGVRPYIRR